ncbi:MAG TPA: FKBP-type peptidyl-prolyl cis-trans isomerase [Gemmatimonadaceae bacterium]
MKSIASLSRHVRHSAGLLALLSAAACGGSGGTGGAGATQRPVLGDVERTQFDPSLNVNLAAMSRRPDDMYVQDLTVGTGKVATTGRTVVVRFTGWLSDGKEFDSGELTVTLGTNKTIRAWEVGLLGMRVGGKRRLIVPPALGYGDKANGPIPANAVLIFEMEMTSLL